MSWVSSLQYQDNYPQVIRLLKGLNETGYGILLLCRSIVKTFKAYQQFFFIQTYVKYFIKALPRYIAKKLTIGELLLGEMSLNPEHEKVLKGIKCVKRRKFSLEKQHTPSMITSYGSGIMGILHKKFVWVDVVSLSQLNTCLSLFSYSCCLQ